MRKSILLTLLVGHLPFAVFANFEPFVISKIQVHGNQKITRDAILQELPVRQGQKLHQVDTDQIISNLYKTGYFDNIELEREQNTLVIKVTERPSISEFEITGIKAKDEIVKIFSKFNIAKGRIYDPTKLEEAILEIEQHYLHRGRYGVRVEQEVNKLDQHRIAIKVYIYEGDEAKIKEIKIVGNSQFTEKELLKQLLHKKTNWLSWFSKDDRYAKEKLAADLEILRSYYMDRGYMQVQVDSTQVSLSPDRKDLYITINITEGDLYYFGDVSLDGHYMVPKAQLDKIINEQIKPGEVYSRRAIIEVKEGIEKALGAIGYSKATVRILDSVNEENKQIGLSFMVDANQLIYVRRIYFKGNHITKDNVLRRGIPQMEANWVSTDHIEQGKEDILRNGYASNVEVNTIDLPGRDDQIDLEYKIEEQRTAQLSAGLQYSGADGLGFNLGADLRNFLGSGKDVDFNFTKTKTYNSYSFGYFNPYFTVDGIGMGYSLYSSKEELSKNSNIFEYSTNSLGGGIYWSVPLSRFSSFSFGFGYDNTQLKFSDANPALVPEEVSSFVAHEGKKYKTYSANVGWTYNSLNRVVFPTKGIRQHIGAKATLPNSKLKYYQLTYDVSWFKPIYKEELIVNLSSELGYANKYGGSYRYPFFLHYFTGGSESIRGFEDRSLGPLDSTDKSHGGNALINARASLIFPPPFLKDVKSVRTSLFFDAGQVYDTVNKRYQSGAKAGTARNPAGLRYSAGLSLTWNSPLGVPMTFAWAKPIKKKNGDSVDAFSFTFQANFHKS